MWVEQGGRWTWADALQVTRKPHEERLPYDPLRTLRFLVFGFATSAYLVLSVEAQGSFLAKVPSLANGTCSSSASSLSSPLMDMRTDRPTNLRLSTSSTLTHTPSMASIGLMPQEVPTGAATAQFTRTWVLLENHTLGRFRLLIRL